jgi:ABC-type multidrug transport system ATPase subunit
VPNLLELQAVAARSGPTPILTSVSLAVAPGECAGVTGPNGAGKTTLLRIAATLRRPSTGTAVVLGAATGTSDVYRIRPQLGLAGHAPAIWPELTLHDHLRLVCDLSDTGPEEADRALAIVGLAGAAGRPAGRCSHGMLRRLDLARLFITRPRLLLLDEPHAGLDADAHPLVEELVGRTIELGGAALLVSHDAQTLAGLADRVHRLRDGVLEADSE